MRNVKTNIFTGALICLLLCCSLFFSCIAEDLSDCEKTRIRVNFTFDGEREYVTRKGGTYRGTLYAFDRDGYCRMAYGFEIEDLNSEILPDEMLEPGTYDFVAWINHDDEYFDLPAFEQFPQVRPKKDAAVLYLDVPGNSTVDYSLPTLLHGAVPEQELDRGERRVTVPLIQDTNYITFRVEGLGRNTDTYEFEVRDSNGAYTFENEFDACMPFRYVSPAGFKGTQSVLFAEMAVLKLAFGRAPLFCFRDRTTGKILYPSSKEQEDNLVELIGKAYGNNGRNVDFDRQHTFEIELRFDASFNATVTVNGWNVVEDDSGLRP